MGKGEGYIKVCYYTSDMGNDMSLAVSFKILPSLSFVKTVNFNGCRNFGGVILLSCPLENTLVFFCC